jgi:polyhydroxybutyrate depolymerase
MNRCIMTWLSVVFVCGLSAAVGPTTAAAEPATRPAAPASKPVPLTPGDHRRDLVTGGRPRSYLVHVPPGYDATKPAPVVLAFHGASMNAKMMVPFCGLNKKADEAGFVAVYPNGTGIGEAVLFFNAWSKPAAVGEEGPPDDVAFTAALLDDLATIVTVDPKRVFATGMSNGGMMCHRLAAELPNRIAAVAAVGGTIAAPDFAPKRPVSVMHFHGTADTIVRYGGPDPRKPMFLRFMSVDDTIRAWVEVDKCPAEPKVTTYPDVAKDGTTVTRKAYGPGKDGTEVVLVEVAGGGHTWPGRQPTVAFLGKSTTNVSANDLLWEFFLRHTMK